MRMICDAPSEGLFILYHRDDTPGRVIYLYIPHFTRMYYRQKFMNEVIQFQSVQNKLRQTQCPRYTYKKKTQEPKVCA